MKILVIKKTISPLRRIFLNYLMILLLMWILALSLSNREKYIRKEEDQEGLLPKTVMSLWICVNKMPKHQVKVLAALAEEERLFWVLIMMSWLKFRK